MASVGYDPASPVSEVRDASLSPGQGSNAVTLQLQTDTQGQWMDWAAGDLAAHLSGQEACGHRGDFNSCDGLESVIGKVDAHGRGTTPCASGNRHFRLQNTLVVCVDGS